MDDDDESFNSFSNNQMNRDQESKSEFVQRRPVPLEIARINDSEDSEEQYEVSIIPIE